MKALMAQELNDKLLSQIENTERPQLLPDEVLIRNEYSSINYKDALGVTGKGKIFKSLPLIPGIDVAGTIIETKSAQFQIGEQVLVTGCGLGETHHGGYAEFTKENAKNVVRCPRGLSLREAMIYGTAGFTAALCVERMLQNGQNIEMGPILITGASGGVGQFAVNFFSRLGFDVWALSGKPELFARLQKLGASKVIQPHELELGKKPLEAVIYGGIVDNVGGSLLSGLIPHVHLWGNVACVGLAGGAELHTTVMPLILRGVSLLGISSNNTTWDLRLKIWQRLATDLKPAHLEDFVTEEVSLEEITKVAQKILGRQTTGRTLVRIIF